MSTDNPNPEQKPAETPATPPEQKPAETPASEELKPLTDEEMNGMSTEEITAHAAKLEAQAKEGKKQTPDQIRENQVKRLKNAQEKVFNQNTAPESPAATPASEKKNEVAQGDILTLAEHKFKLGSEEQTLLQKRVEQGVIANYEEGFTHAGVKAELAAIAEKNTAKTVIDENDDPETQLKTKKEAIAAARASGDIPDDPALQQAIVEDNLNNMSSLN